MQKLTGGRGADVVIEAVGHPETWELAVKLLRRGGIVNFFGGCPTGHGSRRSIPSCCTTPRSPCLASFHHTPALIRKALDAVSKGYITARDFVNREEPLTNLLEVMQHLMSHNGHMKTAIIP